MVCYEFGCGRREGPADVFLHSAGEKKLDGEFGVIDLGDQLQELSDEVVVVALIQCIDNYEPCTATLLWQRQDRIN